MQQKEKNQRTTALSPCIKRIPHRTVAGQFPDGHNVHDDPCYGTLYRWDDVPPLQEKINAMVWQFLCNGYYHFFRFYLSKNRAHLPGI